MMLREPIRDTGAQTKPMMRSRYITADVWVPKPVEIAPAADEQGGELTRRGV